MFIELRCSDMHESYAGGDGTFCPHTGNYDRCWSLDNMGCGRFSQKDTIASGLECIKEVFEIAKKSGWIQIKQDFICPYCASKRKSK